MAEFQLGSISTGTLRTEDLLPKFAHALLAIVTDNEQYELEMVEDALNGRIKRTGIDTRTAVGLLDDIQDSLNQYCPPFVYFGAHPGDGADFGFWADFDAVDESCARKHHRCTHNPETGEIVLEDESVIVQVNDHGNVTVMDMDRNVLWSVV
jgi:hypothetical protein